MRRQGQTPVLKLAALAVLAAVSVSPPARADGTGGNGALGALAPALAALGGDLVTFSPASDEAQVTTLVAAPPAEVAALLGVPASYPQAVPALARTDVVARRPRADGGVDLLIDWELEIPLFNLKGRLWVIPGPDEVALDLFQGNFAPGRLVFTWAPAGAGRTIVALTARINNQAGGWLLRQLVARSRFAGAAVNAAAATVALRGAAALAEHPGDAGARRPHAPPAPPALAAVDGRALGERLLATATTTSPPRALGLIKRAPSGRLALASVAVPAQKPAATLLERLATPEVWRAFPAWKHVDRLPAPAGATGAIDVDVRDNIPFVDFDARWRLSPRPVPRAQAIGGDARGALFGWDVVETSPPRMPAAAIVLSMYPRVEALGYIPRKFVAAEPLLEQSLALALAYVDAMSVAAANQ